ncbi:MAG: ferrous iron transport protein B [Bacteriovoracaceae bacterium]|nr:ferrous iron transport protein B [Bacteriovoracaceae bacterium]
MKEFNVAIAGNPNSGKTTLFNALAGTNHQVANYAGVTVEKKSGTIHYKDKTIHITDLPGTYSLSPFSVEEKVARDYIFEQKPDLIVQVIDASNLERNLYLTVQLLELNVPMIIALNMMDVAKLRDTTVDAEALSKKLKLPVITTVARKEEGKEKLLDAVINHDFSKKQISIKEFSYGNDMDKALMEMSSKMDPSNPFVKNFGAKFLALRYIEEDAKILALGKKHIVAHDQLEQIAAIVRAHIKETTDTDLGCIIADYRYGIVSSVIKDIVKSKALSIDRVFVSDRIDRVVTHKFVGPIVLLGILYFSYHFTFWASEYPISLLESFFGFISGLAQTYLPDGHLKSLVVSGIIDGVGGVLGFTPLILFMFFMIAILEDTGYMARVAYMLDRIFRFFGLQGNSVIPYVISGGIAGGCAVPGVMATRTIKGQKERLITMLTAPFMLCGAKLPVLSLLIAAFFPGHKASLLLLFTVVGWLSALILAKVFGNTIIKGETSSFLMELPPYRFPTLKGLSLHAWQKTWMYVKKAGTIILAIAVILWALMTFPSLPESEMSKYEDENLQAQAALKYSFAGRVGTSLESITKYAGFDWRTNIALLSGIAAKELVVSALGTAYSLGEVDAEESQPLSEKLASDPSWNVGVALALILFTLFYSPCFVTLVMIAKESGSWKYSLFTLFAYTLLAFIISVVVYSSYNALVVTKISMDILLFRFSLAFAVIYFIKRFYSKLMNTAGSCGCSDTDCEESLLKI